MLTIRLQRTGKKNQAQFRVVLAEKESHVSKKFAEVLGSYNPHKKAFSVGNAERLNYWIAQKVDMSPTVHNLLVTNGILKDGKVKSFNIPKKPVVAEVAPVAEASVETPTETPAEAVAPEVVAETPAEAVAEAPTETPVA